MYPGLLEAFLRAEEGLLDAEFETRRALERARGFGAGNARAVVRFETGRHRNDGRDRGDEFGRYAVAEEVGLLSSCDAMQW